MRNVLKHSLAAVLCALLSCLAALAASQQEILQEADRLELAGQFKEAAAALRQPLGNAGLSPVERKVLEFEQDRLERIKKDFPFTKETLFGALKKAVKGLTAAEFDQWIAEGRFDSRPIDGARRFMVSSVSNLFWRYPELSARRVPRKPTASLQRRILESCDAIQSAAAAERKAYVLPREFEVTMRVTAEPDAAPEGELVRAWLPIPRDYPFQAGFHLLSASPVVTRIEDAQSPIRSVFLERRAVKGKATPFRIRYNYSAHGVRFEIDPRLVRAADPAREPDVQKYLAEAPHVRFTEGMRTLSDKIAGSETNPCLKAKKFYDWIAENIKYSYSIEYSTIRNIGEYCRDRGYGDCGQEALLFMTLCRMNGIPARWQSGWNTFPGAKSIHDWTEVYFAPYGWVPVDPYMGIFAMRYATSLRPEQRLKIRDFYFGGLDQYRMIANRDHNQELSPAKESMRSDTVDFQRGELEWGDHNIYLDKFSYDLKIHEIKGAPRSIE